MADDLEYNVEYSKSARAKCKKCKEPIAKDVLRLARIVKSPFHDGKMPYWFHYECFFEKFTLKGTEEIGAFEHIRFEDQKRIEESIEAKKRGPSTSAGGGGGKGKGKGGKRKAEPDVDLTGEYVVQYAKSGKALCKLCENSIANRELRIGKKDHESADAIRWGPLFRWFHVACFVDAREELDFPWAADKLPEFDSLEETDKRELKKQLKATQNTSKPAQVPKMEEKDPAVEAAEKKAAKKEEATLKKQSDEMFGYIEKLKSLRRGELNRLFAANDISFIPDDGNKRLEVLSDALTFGRPENCPNCDGYLRFKVSRYECRGDVTEWEKCSYETEDPKRRVFIIPDDMKESYEFLKEYKGKTGKRLCSSKMKAVQEERKKAQLAQLINIKDEAEGGGDDASTSMPLDGLQVAILGKVPEASEKIVQFGGKVMSGRSLGRSVAFVVSTQKIFTASKAKMVDDCDEHQVPVVSDAIFELLQQGVPLAQAMTQSEVKLWGLGPEKLEERLNNLNVKAKIKETFTGQTAKKKLGVNKMISKGGGVVDAESGLEDQAHILREGDNFYSAVLNLVDVAKDKNSFYKLQLLESDHMRNSFWVFRSWGRIGMHGDSKTEGYSSKEAAIREFSRLYSDKTGSLWELRKSFRKKPGFYFPVDVDYGELDTKLDVAVSTSTLPEPVKYLISLIFDVARMKQTMLEFELDLDKMPLGKLSKAQLLEACSTLKEIATLLEQQQQGSQQDAQALSLTKMQGATNKFYSLVPHNFGDQCPPLITSTAVIAAKMTMLESLMDIELAYDIMKQDEAGEGTSAQAVDPIDAHYRKLNAHIEPLDPASSEYELIQTYLKNTHAATHSAYRLEICHVFKVERAGEDERFAPHRANANRMLLWHGSRLTNFPGILSQGLRIAPPEAPVCGYMFGKGVYFADSVSKSANYCATSAHSNEGLMLLSEVAIGKSQELRDATFVTSLPKKYSSVKGIGQTAPDPSAMHTMEDGVKVPLGKMVRALSDKPSSLLYNEYIVYNEEQIKLRYLLNVKFHYDAGYY